MTKVSRISNTLTETSFNLKKERFENLCKISGYNPDTCLSYKGDKKCFLYKIDEHLTIKMDPNNNSVYGIIDEVD